MKYTFTFLFTLFSISLFSQNFTITGKAIDETTLTVESTETEGIVPYLNLSLVDGELKIVVEKDFAGLSFGSQERKLGWHSQPTAAVIFDNCRIPEEQMVGEPGDGFKIAMKGLDGGRLNIGACSLGGAQRCLDDAVSYVKERRQFGQRIADFQNTQFMLADMKTNLEAARALLYIAAEKVSRKAIDRTQWAAMAKLLTTETGSRVVNDALQLHGGYGFLRDFPIERFLRDLRVHEILEGTNQIMRFVIGRELVADRP